MTNQLTFNAISLTPVIQNNKMYLTARDLAYALGYSRTDSVSRIFDRNKDEFTESMTMTVNLAVSANPLGSSANLQKTNRIFSLRGCHLIAMFSRTAVAKQFRKWVLDILDSESQPQQPVITLEDIVTELNQNPHEGRYLITVNHNGAVLRKQDISDKSLVDTQATRHLRRDIMQMAKRLSELTQRVGVLSGDYAVEDMVKKIK